nr:NSP1-H61A-UG [synthetic construct]
MATFKDACFHYRRLTALNRRLCNIGANSIWMPVPDAKIKGWCLECCQIADLTHCYGCSLPAVCKWCVQNRRCFLDNEPHLLKLRTVKHPITKDKLQCIIDLYNIIFPINDKVIRKFERMIKQRECRNQYKIEWYNHLLLPITLNAAAFKFDENNLYYVFGLYEKSVSDIYAPYRIVNFINEFDKLLLDHINFTRMSNLPIELRNHYAKKYFQLSRLPSSKLKQIYFSDFTKETVIFNTYTKTPGRSIYRNVTEFNWRDELELYSDLKNDKNKLIAAMMTSKYTRFYAHDNNFGRLKMTIFELGHHCQPNYVASNHPGNASDIQYCKWCNIKYFLSKIDWRIRDMYNLLMEFIKDCYKSNVNVGHCSSVENIYPLIKRLIWSLFTNHMDQTIEEVFNHMSPVSVEGTNVIMLILGLNISLYNEIKRTLNVDSIPMVLNLNEFSSIVKSISSKWYNVDELDKLPMSIKSTEELIEMKNSGTLTEEFELLISNSEDDNEDYKDHDGDYKDHDIDYKDDDDKASVEKFVGTWKIADSHNFGEYLKAIGAPKELSDGGDATTPTLYISQKDGDKMTVKIENGPPTFLDTQVKFKLGEEFDEFPSDRRKGVKSVVNLVGEKLVYVQKWDGKETTYVREIKDGKLVVTLTMGDVVAVRSYRRATE